MSNLEKLQAARAAKLGGTSPRQRGAEKAATVLRWIYLWGWCSPSLAARLAGDPKSGVATRLEKSRLVTRTRTESGGGIRSIPRQILTLTENGLEEVTRRLASEADLLEYDLDPFRVRQDTLRHDQVMQEATFRALQASLIEGYLTPRQLNRGSKKDAKEPDAIWIHKSGHRQAVEVELSAKFGRRLDEFVRKTLIGIRDGLFDSAVIVSDSPGLLQRYNGAFAPGSKYSIWDQDASRHWTMTETRLVPEAFRDKVVCQLIDI